MTGPQDDVVWFEACEDIEASDGRILKAGRYWGRRAIANEAVGEMLQRKERYTIDNGPDSEQIELDVTAQVQAGLLVVLQ